MCGGVCVWGMCVGRFCVGGMCGGGVSYRHLRAYEAPGQ